MRRALRKKKSLPCCCCLFVSLAPACCLVLRPHLEEHLYEANVCECENVVEEVDCDHRQRAESERALRSLLPHAAGRQEQTRADQPIPSRRRRLDASTAGFAHEDEHRTKEAAHHAEHRRQRQVIVLVNAKRTKRTEGEEHQKQAHERHQWKGRRRRLEEREEKRQKQRSGVSKQALESCNSLARRIAAFPPYHRHKSENDDESEHGHRDKHAQLGEKLMQRSNRAEAGEAEGA